MKRKPAYRQYSAGLTRWLDRLAEFHISMKHPVKKNLELKDFRAETQEKNHQRKKTTYKDMLLTSSHNVLKKVTITVNY